MDAVSEEDEQEFLQQVSENRNRDKKERQQKKEGSVPCDKHF